MSSKFDYSPSELEINKVIKKHNDDLIDIHEKLKNVGLKMDDDIQQSISILKELGFAQEVNPITPSQRREPNSSPLIVKSWDNIMSETNKRYPNEIVLEDIFTDDEITANSHYLILLRKQFYELNKLDKWDYAVSGIIGTIAALLDYFFVTKVNLKTGEVVPGSLKSGVEKLWDKVLPFDTVKKLEKKYKVPFDISTNTSKISQEVLGLTPKTHRFQSIGHDPLLGFIFGIKDLMKGELTAIDGNGRLIVQTVNGTEPIGFINAIITQFGHLLSDVNAASDTGMKLSIPAPLTPLLQMVQVGGIEYNGKVYTIGDLSKKMYYDGYNFNHFIGMSIPVLVIHIIIHLYSFLRDIFSDSYTKNKHKTDLMIFIANSILCAENVGKLVVTKNPFAINYVSWIDTAKSTVKVLKYVLIDYKLEQLEYVQQIIDQQLNHTYKSVNLTWDKWCSNRPVLELI